jgi:hypothetical protein
MRDAADRRCDDQAKDPEAQRLTRIGAPQLSRAQFQLRRMRSQAAKGPGESQCLRHSVLL